MSAKRAKGLDGHDVAPMSAEGAKRPNRHTNMNHVQAT
jgi:hypothetical protein